MYKRILVPLDGSEVAKQVLPYVKRIAQAQRVRVDLLEAMPFVPKSVRNETGREIPLPYPIPMPSDSSVRERFVEAREQSRQAALQRLDEEAKSLRDAGIAVDTQVVDADDPFEAVVTEADRVSDTLIAMSTHGRTGVGRWMLGSVTDKVVRHSKHPTLVIRARKETAPAVEARMKEVILPLDGSELSEMAIPYATAFARDLGLDVMVLRVITPLAHAYTWGEVLPPEYDEIEREMLASCQAYVDEIADRIEASGVPRVQRKVLDGNPASVILDEVGETGDKIVVMATHGRAGVGRWVLGSVADRVIRHSHGPVLAIRPVAVPAAVPAG